MGVSEGGGCRSLAFISTEWCDGDLDLSSLAGGDCRVIQAFASLLCFQPAGPGAAAGMELPYGISDLHKSLARIINVKICCRLSLTPFPASPWISSSVAYSLGADGLTGS